MMRRDTRIGITLGDPGGIGPEVVVKALARRERLPPASYVLYGHATAVEWGERTAGLRLDRSRFPLVEPASDEAASAKHEPRPENGAASFAYFEAAVRAAREGRLDAIVTGPVSKAAWSLAGLPWRGHTDYLERLYPRAIMAFWSDRLRLALLSHHLALREAIERVTRDNLHRFLTALAEAVEAVRPGAFEFVVAGMNPHAGEGGTLGREEAEEIVPAIEAARADGVRVSGPLPPDVVFRSALDRPGTVAVALYHDQGLIAFKMASFDKGVNVTLGLPFVRTSPDHGTAFDIAGRGLADPESMTAAVGLAAEFAAARSGLSASGAPA
jgi:4-hydroxythreonine-4-phosphate dehydrogenase